MDNEKIKKDVVEQLYWDSRVNASNVQVKVENGEVQLDGSVPTFNARLAARMDAWMVPGVKAVDNNLNVRFPETVPLPNDAEMADNIRNMLRWHPDIDDSHIEISVNAGLVTLRGNVATYWEKLIAPDSATNVNGVLDVKNELTVVPTENYVDQAIGDDIMAAYERNIYINPEDIDVKVMNGKVSLSGTVPDWIAYRAAMNVAELTAGVTDVTDNLRIA